ncbi:MAG: NAD(+)/NADH kinase [Desulfomonile tiedjei]|nr:NAD(+)/NADH kinase [Desulfomonile tiedjei]
MERIGLVLKRGEERAVALAEKINSFLKDSGKHVLLEASLAGLAKTWAAAATDRLCDEADLLVVLGGDGTILRAASLLNDKPIPVLGVNLGRVGFMAEISPEEAITELKSALEGTADYVKRMMLEITLPNGKRVRTLNDVVIHWGGIARLIDMGIRMGNAREIECRADGLIVSTPIGSSAYSYAANGPLVHPEIEGILLTPICPYAGLKRPLIIPAHVETELMLKRGEDLTLTFDGRSTVSMEQGQSLRIVRASIPFVMVKSRARDYFDVLKEKLGLL